MTTGPFTEQTLLTVLRETVAPSLAHGLDTEIGMNFERNTITLKDVSTEALLTALNTVVQEAHQ